MEKLSRFYETDNSVKARNLQPRACARYRFNRWHCGKMKSLSAVYCLSLWTYFNVFAFMVEAPRHAGDQMGMKQYGAFISLNPLTLLKNQSLIDENVRRIEVRHTLETVQFTDNGSAATESRNGHPSTSEDLFGPFHVSVDLSLASKNSCVLTNKSVYSHDEQGPIKWVNILNIKNSSFEGAALDAEDLSQIITKINESNNTAENSNIISNLTTLHFLMDTNGTTMRNKPGQDYPIFRCTFFINNSTVTKITRGERVWKKEKHKNVSFTIRLQGSYDEFNLRGILEDMDKFVQPSFCSSKIPFFYSLVITGELKRSSVFLLFVSFNYILSTCSLVLIFITAKLSHEWRQRRSNIILINFALSIFSQIMLHFISDFSEIDEGLCTVVTVLCHYFTLVQFFWTSTIAYMQYRRYVQVFEEKNSYFLVKLILFTWITPILVISASLIFVFSIPEKSKKTCGDKFKVCSLINTYLLKYSVSLPLFFTLLVNFIFFILIFRHLLRRKFEFDQRTSALVEVKLAFVLFFLLDLNLIVAIIADMFSIDILAMIFVTSHSLQGVLLFVVFVIRNKCSRKMYVRWMKIMLDRMAFYIC